NIFHHRGDKSRIPAALEGKGARPAVGHLAIGVGLNGRKVLQVLADFLLGEAGPADILVGCTRVLEQVVAQRTGARSAVETVAAGATVDDVVAGTRVDD